MNRKVRKVSDPPKVLVSDVTSLALNVSLDLNLQCAYFYYVCSKQGNKNTLLANLLKVNRSLHKVGNILVPLYEESK